MSIRGSMLPGKLLTDFRVSSDRGFLPSQDPLPRLSSAYDAWEESAALRPDLLNKGSWGRYMQKLPLLGVEKLAEHELERAQAILAFNASAFVWELWKEGATRPYIPANIAVPFVEISERLGRHPILSYVSYALHNWRRVDPSGPITADNLTLLQYFLGDPMSGSDETWFTTIHVDMEAKAGRGIVWACVAQEQALLGDIPFVAGCLLGVYESLVAVNATFARMPEHCRPDVYYNRVRPWIHGWTNQPTLPGGVIYEGVEKFLGPKQFRGETGAQSSIMPLLDAIFGVEHAPSMLSQHLMEMRDYMPREHRGLIAFAESQASIRPFVLAHPDLKDVYNACIEEMHKFSMKHLEYASVYINRQARGKAKEGTNPTAIGTGGTPFMESLKKHSDERLAARV